MTASDAPSAARASRTALYVLGGLVLLVVGSGTAYLLSARQGSSPVEAPKEDPTLAALSSSPFRNTNPSVGYVGSAECVRCHDAHAASFRRTGMGRSMAPVDPRREPPDASYDHPASKRRYQVVRRDG
jgi:hypothetical protein